MKEVVRRNAGLLVALLVLAFGLLLPALGYCTPTELTVPDIDTGILNSSAGKVFAGLAIFVAICWGLRLFRKA